MVAGERVCGAAAVLVLVMLTVPSVQSVIALSDGDLESAKDDPFWQGGGPEPYPFRDFQTVVDILYQTCESHPQIAMLYDVGDTWEKIAGKADRDILALKISDNPGVDEDEPAVLIMARHHANEAPPTEIALQLIENLTDPYGVDARISWLVDNREIWVIPVVNPDGMQYFTDFDDSWRKNRRDNGDGSFGVDLNRNYNGSENGDPLGAWGGAGTSFDPSSPVYCGESAFSEPETQAVRNLAYSQGFAVAADFHAAADCVMWPWGYTTNLTPDDEDLVRIGTELASLNGYVAAQSIAMYPTTGDTLDWLYGGADVYPFLFEVGGWVDYSQHDEMKAVLSQIAENMPPALRLIEIAGDREQRQFAIDHVPLGDMLYSGLGVEVVAEISAERGVAQSGVSLSYRVDGGTWEMLPMEPGSDGSTYAATIPAQAGGACIEYYIVAMDMGGVELMAPRYAPYETYSFSITPDTEAPVSDAGTRIMAHVGETVTFDGSGSTDNVGIASYVWSFEMGGSLVVLTGVAPSYTFSSSGSFLVTLTVTDTSGNAAADTVLVGVIDGRNG